MSAADVERFVVDLKTNTDLMAKVENQAAGLDSVVALAREHGYDISVDDAKAYIQAQSGQALTDDQMEALAGGKAGQSVTHTGAATQTMNDVVVLLNTSTQDAAQVYAAGGSPVEPKVVVVVT